MSKTSVLSEAPILEWERKFSGLGEDLTGLRPFNAGVWLANGETGGKVYRVSVCGLKMKKVFPENGKDAAKRYAEKILASLLEQGAGHMKRHLAEQGTDVPTPEEVRTPKRRKPKDLGDDT